MFFFLFSDPHSLAPQQPQQPDTMQRALSSPYLLQHPAPASHVPPAKSDVATPTRPRDAQKLPGANQVRLLFLREFYFSDPFPIRLFVRAPRRPKPRGPRLRIRTWRPLPCRAFRKSRIRTCTRSRPTCSRSKCSRRTTFIIPIPVRALRSSSKTSLSRRSRASEIFISDSNLQD